jgi:hypothetical protein
MAALQKYAQDEGILLKNLGKEKLNDVLCKFYLAVRTNSGDNYKTNSLLAMRQGIRRYF